MKQVSGVLRLPRGTPAQHQRREADLVDEVAGGEPGHDAAAGPVEALQRGMPGSRAQELIYFCERAGQIRQPGRVTPAGHGAVPAWPNPAQAEVPGWAEYASSATVTGPPARPAPW